MTQKRGEKQIENIADDIKPSEVEKTKANYKESTKYSCGIGEEKNKAQYT